MLDPQEPTLVLDPREHTAARPVPQPGTERSSSHVSGEARTPLPVPGRQPAALTMLAVVAAVIASAGDLRSPDLSARLLCAAGAAVFIVSATMAVLRGATWLRTRTAARIGETHASVVRILAVVTGAAGTLLLTLGLLAVPVGQLLLGGALTGALLGIAGQQTLANLIAGVVLLFTRTVSVGDHIRLHSGTLGGTFEGTVTEIGLIHVHLRTPDAPLAIPNTQLLSAAIAVVHPHTVPPATTSTARPRRRGIRRRQPHPAREPATPHTTRILPAVHQTSLTDSAHNRPTATNS
ncbi:mechanosensitive ion channel domain-containing protein [Streptosporangium sp. NPDC050855]|uniref:mechanosensitive ion channel domain-containing protein n=1 Tax=Streptosporangium sp. NPDC050855 TaxID=3366194 RepID=UPI00378DCB1C